MTREKALDRANELPTLNNISCGFYLCTTEFMHRAKFNAIRQSGEERRKDLCQGNRNGMPPV